MRMAIAFLVGLCACAGSTGQTAIRVNAGGAAYTDSLGRVWQADTGFIGGGPESYATAVSGTADQPLFKDYRWNPTSYGFSVANGSYQVSLYFTENAPQAQFAGARVFSVTMQGATVIPNLDIFKTAGGNAALVKTVTVSVTNGKLTIGFVPASSLMPKVSAIEIASAAAPADTSAPTVAILAPTAGATISGIASITASAADNTGVAGVQLQVDGANSGTEDAAAPYTMALDTTKLSNGSHTLTAVARDAAGNRTTSAPVAVTVTNNSAAGLTTIRVNSGGAAYTDKLGQAWAADSGFAGGNAESYATLISGTPDSALFQDYRWNPESYSFSVTPGQYQVSLLFTENNPQAQFAGSRVFTVNMQGTAVFSKLDVFALVGGNAALVKTATVSVPNGTLTVGFTPISGLMPKVSAIQIVPAGSVTPDVTAPTVAITSPVGGASVSGSLGVAATAADNVGVVGVQFQVDGANLGAEDAASPYSGTLDTTSLVNGTHTLTAIARDAAGNHATSAGVAITVSNPAAGATGVGPLRVLASNPRYFTDGSGKAIYLAGSHTWANLVDQGTTDPPSIFDYTAFLDFLQAQNHNFFRLWTWTLPHMNDPQRPYSTPQPWLRVGPGRATDGKAVFDLSQFDQSYFDRMRQRVIAAGQRGMYVSVMLFDGYDLQFYTEANDGDPFVGGNNVNGISCAGTCPHSSSQSATVTALEQAYLRKVVDTVSDLDNVLYEVANEAGAPYSTSWQYGVINYVKQYESTKPKQHPAGMTFQYSGGTDQDLYSSPADWISPVTRVPPAADGRKVVVNDTDHSYYWTALKSDGQGAQRAWAWENFTRGNNLLFMDPYLVVWPQRNAPGATTTDPYWDTLRHALGRTRTYAQKMNLAAMTPQGGLSSTGYCLASAGAEYLAYNPSAGAFALNVRAGVYSYEWYNPATGTVVATGFVTGTGSSQTFTPPFSGDSVLYLKAN